MEQIPAPDIQGLNNSNLGQAVERQLQGYSYADLSTVVVTPARDLTLDYRFVNARDALVAPMNQKTLKLIIAGCEVADAYNKAIETMLSHPDLKSYRFLVTLETDNLPPPDGLVKLQRAMLTTPYAGIGGLYWVKGENQAAMIYGDPRTYPVEFRPQVPVGGDAIQECRGIAQGFSIFDMNLFKDKRLGPPWFRTMQHWSPSKGIEAGTQDLEFCGRAVALGYRFAVANSVRVGHIDYSTGVIW